MEKEKIRLFPDELPAPQSNGRPKRDPRRQKAFRLAVLCACVFALGALFSEAVHNGTIKLPEFIHSANGTTSSPAESAGGAVPDAEPAPDESVFDPDSIYDFDYSLIKDGETAVIPADLSLSEYGDTYLYNDTDFLPALQELLEAEASFPTADGSGEPLVLIIHTHTSEAYSDEGQISYSDDEEYARSDNGEENVIAVGAVIAEVLNENGIKTLHCVRSHDKSYKDSYARSRETAEYYLDKYPSIKYVFDVHRDSIIKSSGEIVRPVAAVGGGAVAQIMCVVGTDQLGADYEWEQNLSLALKLRSSLNEKYGNIARGTCLRPTSYNQELAPISLLFEIGAGGNSLSEAKAAARLLALELAEIIGAER